MQNSRSLDVAAKRALRKPGKVRPLTALRAIMRLVENPQDTRQVFELTEALRGRSGIGPFKRFCESATGRRILAERRALLATLSDRETLAALPEGSLGRAYAAFMAAEALSAEELVAHAGPNPLTYASPDRTVRLFSNRMRDMHDLYHVLTGYGRDELGEVCVLAFCYPQQRIRSFFVLSVLGAVRVSQLLRPAGVRPHRVFAAIWEAALHGWAAAWLPGEDLEAMLAEDLSMLRVRLKIRPPCAYQHLT